MRILYISLFLFLQMTVLSAQAVYSTAGPCSESSLAPDVKLITTFGDDLIYEDLVGGTNILYRLIGDDDFRKVELIRGDVIIRDLQEDYFLLTKADSLFLVSATMEIPELITVAPENIDQALFWNEEYYFTTPTTVPGAPFNSDDIVKYDPETEQLTILYTGAFGGFRGLGATDNYVIAIGNAPEGKGLVRTDGTLAGTTYFHTLFPGGNEFYLSRYVYPTRMGDKLFFFYGGAGGAPENSNVLFITDGTSEGTTALESFNLLSFDNPPAPIVVEDKLFFIQTRLGAPSGTTESLFSSDGTVAGTLNLDPTPEGSYLSPDDYTVLDNTVYFDGAFGLYRTINNGTSSELILSNVFEVAAFSDSLVINYAATFGNTEPHIVAASGEDPRLLSDLVPGEGGSSPAQLTAGDSVLYFVPNSFSTTRQVFVYDLRQAFDPYAIIIDSVSVIDVTDAGLGSVEVFVPQGSNYEFSLNDGPASDTSFFGALSPGNYLLTITNQVSGCTDSLSFTVDNLSAIWEITENNAYQAYPNPIKGGQLSALKLDYLGQGENPLHQLAVYDFAGRHILSSQSGNSLPSGASLTKGQYLLIGFDLAGKAVCRLPLIVQ